MSERRLADWRPGDRRNGRPEKYHLLFPGSTRLQMTARCVGRWQMFPRIMSLAHPCYDGSTPPTLGLIRKLLGLRSDPPRATAYPKVRFAIVERYA
jgi:hypothetical protein